MTWFRNPRSLQEILFSNIAKSAVSRCPTTDNEIKEFYRNIQSVRNYFAVLPPTVFEQLAQAAFKSIRCSITGTINFTSTVPYEYPRQLYLLEIFLQEHIRNVSINLTSFKTPSYFTRLLVLLRENHRNLLSIAFKTCTHVIIHPIGDDYQLLKQVIFSATNLTLLTLRGICTDEMLGAIGRNCSKLSELDISFSPVTDIGLNLLTQNITEVKQYTGNDDSQWESTVWRLPDVFPAVTQLVPVSDLLLQENEVKHYLRTKNPLCSTLCKLNLIGSYVSYRGVLVVLELLSKLQVLGYNLDNLLIYLLHKAWTGFEGQSEPFKLTKVDIMCLTNQNLTLAKALFPQMQNLKFHFISENVTSDIIPHLECLNVDGFLPGSRLNVLKQYLSNKGQTLKELSLSIMLGVNNDFNISSILTSCTNLIKLTLRNMLRPLEINQAPVEHTILKSINLDSFVTEDTLINILKGVPNIEKIIIGILQNRTENFIPKICDVTPRPKLNTFWVNNGRFLETEEELILFLNAFDQIKVLGKLPSSLQKFDFETFNNEEDHFIHTFHVYHQIDHEHILDD